MILLGLSINGGFLLGRFSGEPDLYSRATYRCTMTLTDMHSDCMSVVSSHWVVLIEYVKTFFLRIFECKYY